MALVGLTHLAGSCACGSGCCCSGGGCSSGIGVGILSSSDSGGVRKLSSSSSKSLCVRGASPNSKNLNQTSRQIGECAGNAAEAVGFVLQFLDYCNTIYS